MKSKESDRKIEIHTNEHNKQDKLRSQLTLIIEGFVLGNSMIKLVNKWSLLVVHGRDGLLLLDLFDHIALLKSSNSIGLDQVDVLSDLNSAGSLLTSSIALHSIFEESALTGRLNLCNSLHSLNSGSHKVTVVSDRDISSLLEFECAIHTHLFTSRATEGLGPTSLTGISLLLERFVAFGSTESKDLDVRKQDKIRYCNDNKENARMLSYLAIITHKSHTMARIARA